MLKQYKILVNEGKGSDNALITVPAGAGARGNPTRITAKPDTRYELQDELKGKGLGPDQVRGKRVGKNLYLMFEDNGKPDIIIEGYYDPVNLQQVPTIVGKAENGSIYEYIPHDPELSSMSTTLKDGTTPAMLSLGGGPIAGGAFELAGLPLVAAAAAGGGLGGLGLAAAGLGAAALGGGGGGGGGAGGDKTPPSKPTSLAIPENNNGGVSAAEATDGTTLDVGLPADAVVGDVLKTVVKKPDGTSLTLPAVTLTAAMIAAKTVTHTIPAADLKGDGVWSTSSTLTDAAGNASTPIEGTFTLDTIAPTPVVSIDTDKSNDGTITSSEISSTATTVDVSATFANKANLKVGDKLKFTDSVSGVSQEVTLDSATVAAGVVKTTFARPKDGLSLSVTAVLTDTASNLSATSNTDTAVMGDTTAPIPVGGGLDCYLKHDTDNDRAIDNDTGADQFDSITQTRTPILVGKVEANANVSVLVDSHTYTTKADSNGDYAVSVTNALKDGPYTPVVTATDAFGNSKSTDGTPFYVDNLSDKNQKPTLDLPDTNTAAKVLITSISDDTRNSGDVNSTLSDFVTNDNTLIYKGTVEKFDNNGDYIKLELKDSKNIVIATEYLKPENLTWTWNREGVNQADGKYTLDATIVDAAGNRVNMSAAGQSTQVIYISNKSLLAVDDSDQDLIKSPGLVKAVEAGFNVPGSAGSGNVLANDKNDILGYTGIASNKTVKLIGSNKGTYGDIDLHADGTYTYTLNNALQAVNSLRAGLSPVIPDTFVYEVTDFSGAKSTASLKVTVLGSNDQASISIIAPSAFTIANLGKTFGISVADADADEGKFIKLSMTEQQGTYGNFTVNEINNEWSYQWTAPVSNNGKNVHDLVVITSVDGASSNVIDVNLAGSGTITQQEFNTKTTNGLILDGTTSTFDVLKITGLNQTLDLTKVYGGLTSQIGSIEVIDLGSSSNKLVLNLDDLIQADQGLLYVNSTANSLVTFVNGTGNAVASSGTRMFSGSNYNVYQIDSYELLVQTTINQISFSAT